MIASFCKYFIRKTYFILENISHESFLIQKYFVSLRRDYKTDGENIILSVLESQTQHKLKNTLDGYVRNCFNFQHKRANASVA